jgi:DNA repair protein RadC
MDGGIVMKDHTERRKRVDIVKLRSVNLVKEGSMFYAKRKIKRPSDCVELLRTYMDGVDREVFVAVALDTKKQPTAIQTISMGTLNSTPVHPREVFKMAILANADSLIIAHNHPSGNARPSKADVTTTERIKECGELLGISLIDHIIVGDDEYTSFVEEDLI